MRIIETINGAARVGSLAILCLSIAIVLLGVGINAIIDYEYGLGTTIIVIAVLVAIPSGILLKNIKHQEDAFKAVISGPMTVEELESQYIIIDYDNGIWTLKDKAKGEEASE